MKLKKYIAAFAFSSVLLNANTNEYKVICSVLNVRTDPFISNNKLYQIEKDSIVKVFGKTNDWCKISSIGEKYVYCKYLTPVESSDTNNVINTENIENLSIPDVKQLSIKENYLMQIIVKLIDEVNNLKNEVQILKVKNEK